MTAATYTFTLSAAQSSASSMIVELQPDNTSSTPGTDGRWQGGTRPRITLNWAANVLTAQGTVNTAPNSAVDGNAVYKWVKISSTPSDLTLDTSALPTVTITDDDTGGGTSPTLTYIYGPKDGAADSGVLEIQSTQQQCGRTWQAGAPSWKVHLGEAGGGTNAATALRIIFSDGAGKLTYMPFINASVISSRSVDVAYTGAAPSSSEPYTFVVSDTTSVRYYCAATIDRANPRLLATIPYSIWDDTTFWGDQNTADRVPGKQAESNAELQLANGIYAARLGAIQ